MIDFLNNIDTQILLFFNSIHTPLLDNFFWIVTGKYVWIPMYATALLILLKGFSTRQAIALAIGVVLAITMADQLCASVIRPLCERMRPANLNNPLSEFIHVVNDYRGGRYGFPSCHAANSFALATIMALIVRYRRFTCFIIGWAILNSYSRIYLGVHYPGDLLVGAVIGSTCAALCYLAVARITGINRGANDHADMPVVYAAPTGPWLAPVMGMTIVNFRISDIFSAVGYTTIAITLLASLAML